MRRSTFPVAAHRRPGRLGALPSLVVVVSAMAFVWTGLTAPAATAGVYSWAVRGDDPIALYRFNETAGATTAVNEVGPGTYDATYQSAVTVGTAGLGSTDTIGGHPLLGFEAGNLVPEFSGGFNPTLDASVTSTIGPLGDNYTVECWFKTDSAGTLQYLVNRGHKPASGTPWDAFGIYNGVLILFNGTTVASGPTPVTSNVWHHAAFTRSGTQVQAYMDGRLVPEIPTQTLAKTYSQNNISIGTRFDEWPFDGKIDEVSVFNRTLTAEEIHRHYYAAFASSTGSFGMTVLGDNPAAYWRMSEASGTTTVTDFSGRGNNATYGSTVGVGGALPSPAQVPGLDNLSYAPSFPGNASTGIVSDEVPGLGNDYTIEGWFYNERPVNEVPITGYLFSRAADASIPGDNVGIWGTVGLGGAPGQLFWFDGTNLAFGSILNTLTWYHVTMVRSGNNVSVYLDGDLELTASYAAAFPVGETSIRLGTRFDSAWPFLGKMRDAVVFSSALSPEQIHAHYLAGATFVPEPSGAVLSGLAVLGMLCLEGLRRGGRRRRLVGGV